MTVQHAYRVARSGGSQRILRATWMATALIALCIGAFSAYAGDTASSAAVDPAIRKALDYKIPERTCTAPVERIRSDGNSNALKFERQTRNYTKCLHDYTATLTKDRDDIKAALSKGVTHDQAAIIQPKVSALSSAIAAASNQ